MNHPMTMTRPSLDDSLTGSELRRWYWLRSELAAVARTLGEAVEHWHATRSAQRPAIGPQFELNRFSRAWHRAHPGGSRADLLAAWSSYRSLPVDARPAPDTAR